MKLIDEWKECWKWFSVQANAVGAAMITTYLTMYDHLKETISPKMMMAITAAVFVMGIVGRVVNQTKEQ